MSKYQNVLLTILMLAPVGMAQIGPESRPEAEFIRQGLILDLDADRGVEIVDGRVASWTNQVDFKAGTFVATRDAGHEKGTGRPALKRKVAALRGHSTVVFNRHELINSDEDAFDHLITGSGYTWLAVMSVYAQVSGLKDVNSFFGDLKNGGMYEGFWAGLTDHNVLWMGSRNGITFGRWDQNNPQLLGPKLAEERYYVVAGRMGAGTGTATIELFVNGTTPVASKPFPVNPIANSSKMAIGQERDATNHPGHESFDGELARFLIWDRPLSDSELDKTMSLLLQTYGIRESGAESKQTYTFKRVGGLEIKADVHRRDDQEVRPVVVWIHGGALIMGGREGLDGRIKKMFLDAGYAIVSIDYRLAPETKLPAIIEDIEDAFKWIREQGPELFGIDSSRIAVLGGSAGGYLTLATGYRVQPRPTVLVSFWGYGDLIGDWYSTPSPHPRHHRSKLSEDEVRKQITGPPVVNARDRNGDGGAFYQFCRQRGIWPQEVSGWDPHREAKKFEQYMPLNNVTAEYPPTLLIHGTQDTDVPYEQSVLMAGQFKKHGIDHELITIEGAEHGLAGGDPREITRAYERAFEFVHRRMTADSLREPAPDPNRGLYAIWAKPDALELPFIKGGQVVVQWRDLQSGEDKYDFSQLDTKLEAMHRAGRAATVQVNGNQHPAFLFKTVPCHPERLSIQVADKQGTLQYWHPAYVKAYCDFLAAYAEHLRQSPFRSAILGVRLNFNAIGTEHTHLAEAERDPRRWICPPAVSPGPVWTPKTATDYKRLIVDTFVKNFSPEIRVFVRNNVFRDFGPDRQFESMFETGRLALFHTSTEVEPRSKGVEAQYLAFLRFCRPGNTLAYAESWADAWGRHGGKTDARWCSPCQWNYWRLLADLHCGVSFIAIYGADLAHADDPQFRAALEFAQKYAGYHASPSASPGAWIALREGDFLKGDYTFLMERLPDDATVPKKNVGPDDQRFGAWARTIPAGGRLRLSLDERFARSLEGRKAIVRVIYLDSEKGSFNVVLPRQTWVAQMTGSERWTTTQLIVPSASFEASASKPDIEIQTHIPVSFHMIEVTRVR